MAGLVSFYLKAENTEGGKLDGEWTENGQSQWTQRSNRESFKSIQLSDGQ